MLDEFLASLPVAAAGPTIASTATAPAQMQMQEPTAVASTEDVNMAGGQPLQPLDEEADLFGQFDYYMEGT